MKDVVISLCDKTGNIVRPWAESGYECWCVDFQHSIRRDKIERVGAGVIHFVWGDIRSWRLPIEARGRVAMGFAQTPCTDLTCSDARDFQKKGGWLLSDGVQLFDSAEVAFTFGGFPYVMENPVGRLNTHRRKPDYSYQPWEYGDLYTKKTCLWAGGGFIMPPKIYTVKPDGVKPIIHMMAPSEDRADRRSETPMGFSRAVFEANHQPKHLQLLAI